MLESSDKYAADKFIELIASCKKSTKLLAETFAEIDTNPARIEELMQDEGDKDLLLKMLDPLEHIANDASMSALLAKLISITTNEKTEKEVKVDA